MEIWKEARALTQKVRKICKKSPANKDFAWVDQISRSSLSVMANIAEGFDAQSDVEFATFAGFAKRSAAEVRSHLFYGLDELYIDEVEFQQLTASTKKIGAGLANLIAYLRASHRKVRAAGVTSD